MIKLSVTSKLDGIRSWSLQAIDTCQGAINPLGGLVDACQGCYATTGNYRFDHYSELREEVQNGFIEPYNMSESRISEVLE